MRTATRRAFIAAALSVPTVGLFGAWATTTPAADAPAAVKIGVVGTLFSDLPAPLATMATAPLRRYMTDHSGMNGEIAIEQNPAILGDKLAAKDVHLAVFHGFEFAWARAKHPELKPLVIAVKNVKEQRAVILVRADDPVEGVAGLKGRTLAVGKGTRAYCRLFLNRTCESCGCGAGEFFGELQTPASASAAIDGVVHKKYDAVVTDNVVLEAYKKLKPKWHGQLREIHKSDPFPASVLAYREGSVDPKALEILRKCLLSAHDNAQGRSMLTVWDLQKFETPDAEYEAALEQIAKAYPPAKE